MTALVQGFGRRPIEEVRQHHRCSTDRRGKAAQRLCTTQPNISRTIAGLEHTLGVRLLDRRREGVEPTQFGLALLDCGRAVFDDLRRGMKSLESLADPESGEVRIGSSSFFASTFISAVIERLSRRYPRAVSHLVTVTETDKLQDELSQRNVDLLIARKPEHASNDEFAFESLYNDSHVVVAGTQSPWVRKRSITLRELTKESWLLPPPERALGPVYLDVFRTAGLAYPRAAVFTVDPVVRIGLLTTGPFLTIVPAAVVRFSKRQDIKILPLDLKHAVLPIGVITLKNRTLSPVTQLFIDGAREVAKVLSPRKLVP
jgi:DNA-binding transcriptional LysR family regulator